MSLPDAAPVIDLIEAFRRSKTMFAAVDLRIFDRLAGGPKGAFDLAAEGGADTMARLLDACVSLGFLEKNGDLYSNTALSSAYLCRDSPHTMAGYISYSNRALYPMWAHLEDAVREGSHRWKQTFGFEGGSLFSHFYRTPEDRREFLLGMHGFGLQISPAVVAAFDLSPFKRMVDLGGGTGHLAMAAGARYPHMSTAVFDLPEAVESAREFTAGSQVDLLPGDFFAAPLPHADLYALGRILHDWSEENIRLLLDRIYASLPPGGGLLIAEKLLTEDLSGPVHAHMQSLNMLICTEGRERSFSQYAGLLQEAGFAEMEGRLTGTGLDAILARKN